MTCLALLTHSCDLCRVLPSPLIVVARSLSLSLTCIFLIMIRKIIRFTFYPPYGIFSYNFIFHICGAGDSAKEKLVPHVTDDTDILEQAATAY
jgi:hypothetical protein